MYFALRPAVTFKNNDQKICIFNFKLLVKILFSDLLQNILVFHNCSTLSTDSKTLLLMFLSQRQYGVISQ